MAITHGRREGVGSSAPDRGPADIKRATDVLLALAFAELRARYGRGSIRLVKWIFDPFAAVGVYLLLVTLILDLPGEAPGLSIACAVIAFQIVLMTITSSMDSIRSRASIILNMGFRRGLIPLAVTMTESMAFASSLALLAMMMAIYGVAPTTAILWFPAVLAINILFAAACAFPMTLVGLWYEDMRPFVISFVRTMFFLAPGLVPLSQIGGDACGPHQAESADRPVRGIPGRAAVRQRARGVGASVPARGLDSAARRVRAPLPPRAAPLREADLMSAPARARIRAEGLGVKFWVDSHRRPLTPALAHLRRKGSVAWGVKDLDLNFEPGERVALVGPSGSGKTTLLRVIAGVLPADAGTIEVTGRVGCLLSTDAGLLPTLTGRENAVLLGVLGGLSRADSKSYAEQVRTRSGLDGAFDRHASSLSAGMKARLGVATAWETDPQILLLDEVHEALDLEFREELSSYADTLTSRGGIVVAAGQDLNLLGQMCRRGIFLRSGEVQVDGPFAQARDAYFENEHTRG